MKMKTNKTNNKTNNKVDNKVVDKPDFKTESLEVTNRKKNESPKHDEFMFRSKKNEKGEKVKVNTRDDELVIYEDDDIVISSLEFKKVVDADKNNKLVFAYKLVKNENDNKSDKCLIYMPNDITDEELNNMQMLLQHLKESYRKDLDYVLAYDYIQPILTEKRTIININIDKDNVIKKMRKENMKMKKLSGEGEN